ncbi:wall-associated receptor kinase 4-like [Panicum miliaceum]|uniref:Wall-associated receptor kinase 4-like n=1 Tax=Panicum miliaceum TaxID=4540 RepID=A0A3L6PQ67_PANMI|nr:wall-associated receptor kinase 4-like [Panicum miliaceum]
MVVEKSGYNFSTPDLYGDKALPGRFPRGVPVVLDFAIVGDAACPQKGQRPPPNYACVSNNSYCVNATVGQSGYALSYVCKCSEHYEGNLYIANGCQDIDECKFPDLYYCSSNGICKNRLRGYDCPCKPGMKGDGKLGNCAEKFHLVAKVIVGTTGCIFVIVVMSFIFLLRKEKKKTREFYEKNGGPTLEKAKIIKLFKKEELMPILKDSNFIGKGNFGEVFKGNLGNEVVAVKKMINGNLLENEQFANEVIIQSQVIHRNIVRFIGCCLEVDTRLLVYEFLSNGSLHDILHSKGKKPLNLDIRLSIAAQSADGLAYMHSKTNTKILHGDVKPANILLDDKFVPKISDFGISRLIARDRQHTAKVTGDMSYMDPVYLQSGLLTEKSDELWANISKNMRNSSSSLSPPTFNHIQVWLAVGRATTAAASDGQGPSCRHGGIHCPFTCQGLRVGCGARRLTGTTVGIATGQRNLGVEPSILLGARANGERIEKK